MKEPVRLAVIAGVLACAAIGGVLGGVTGGAIGLLLGIVALVVPWRRQPVWVWVWLHLRRNRAMELEDPSTVAADRPGGVRFQDGVAVAAIQLLGRRCQPTLLIGSTSATTANSLDVSILASTLTQNLGLRLESLSVVTAGARRCSTGDYPQVYDTLIGTNPYAGQREAWIVMRLRALDNGDALRFRPTVGTAVLAAAQRTAIMLRCSGIRARVATATEVVELDRRLASGVLELPNRRWHSLRGDAGWHTTYAYQPGDVNSEALAQAWSLRADGIVQNVTLYPGGTVSASVTLRTAQPPTASPSLLLQTLPGEQPQAAFANLAGPRPEIRGLRTGPLPSELVLPLGASGILLGRVSGGGRLLVPFGDPGDPVRVHIAAEDAIAKRIIVRVAGAGDRVTVHTTDVARWASVRMPHVAVVEHARPVTGTTVSVVDGTVAPAPRPHTVISVGPDGSATGPSADITIAQTGPDRLEVWVAGERHDVEMEFFRAENRYVSAQSVGALMEMAD